MSAIIGHEIVTLTIPGTLTTSSIVTMAMPFKGTIVGAHVAVTTAPTGAALTADLKVGSNVAAAFSIAINGTSDEGTLTPANCGFTAGSLVSLDVSQIGSSVAGANMTVSFLVTSADDAAHVADASYND